MPMDKTKDRKPMGKSEFIKRYGKCAAEYAKSCHRHNTLEREMHELEERFNLSFASLVGRTAIVKSGKWESAKIVIAQAHVSVYGRIEDLSPPHIDGYILKRDGGLRVPKISWQGSLDNLELEADHAPR